MRTFGRFFFAFLLIGCSFGLIDPDNLRLLYNTLNGGNWVKSYGWNDVNNKDPLTWYGVSANNGAYYLKLQGNNLAGQLDSNFGIIIAAMTTVELGYNPGIIGAIPDSFSQSMSLSTFECTNCQLSSLPNSYPPNLKYLFLGNNNFRSLDINGFFDAVPIDLAGFEFTGAVINADIGEGGAFFGNLKQRSVYVQQIYLGNTRIFGKLDSWQRLNLQSLTYLDLKDNQLEGGIPDWLFNSQSIILINLSNNTLEGKLPPMNAPKLEGLYLQGNNQLSGGLPSVSENIRYINLGGCSINDKMSSSFSISFPHLLELDISNNQLEGPIPEIDAPNLEGLYLGNNRLGGYLPKMNFVNLTYLILNDNQLGGELPASLFALQRLEQFNISSNNFTGKLPVDWNNPSLKSFAAEYNNFDGKFPLLQGSSNLQYLQIGHNQFSGDFPTFLNCPELLELSAPWNQFDSMPKSLNCLKLKYLDMDNNLLKGNFSSGLESLNSLVQISASNNQLEGNVPSVTSQYLTGIFLGNNSFSGNLPSSLSSLPSLIWFYVFSNKLEGAIPDLTQSTSLNSYDVSDNKFTSLPSFSNNNQILYFSAHKNSLRGVLSSKISNMNSLRSFLLYDNFMSGPIEPGFFSGSLEYIDISNNQFNGSIPICDCSGLKQASFNKNNFSGDLTMSWFSGMGSTPVFEALYLQDNQISGFLPPYGTASEPAYLPPIVNLRNNKISGSLNFNPLIRFSSTLSQLDLSCNQLSGNLTVFNPTTSQWSETKRAGIQNGPPETNESPMGLSNLILFNASHNFFSGDFNFTAVAFSSLWNLYLNDNKFNGALIGDFNGDVDISNNQFTGTLSNRKGRITSLKASNNRFTDLLDPNSSNLDILNTLIANNNSLQSIGKSMSGAVNLRVLDLSLNPINNFDNSLYTILTQLTDLNLSRTSIKSNIPNEISKLRSLTNYDISSSHFFGSIPEDLGKLAYLTYFNGSFNSLEGNIPLSFKYSRYLEILDLSHNRLTGGIEESVGYLVSLTHLDLSFNLLNGNISTNVGSLLDMRVLKARNNSLSGSLPNTFPHNMVELDLSGNRLTGSIPENFGELTNLESLDLSWNLLGGNLPKSFEKLRKLEVLYLQFNNLSLPNAIKPLWVGEIECDAQNNDWECPLPHWMIRDCSISQCKISSNISVDLELRLLKKDSQLDEETAKLEISIFLNITAERIKVNYIRDGGLFTVSKRQNSSPSILLGITINPPSQGSENEGSALRNREILLSYLAENNEIGSLSVLQYSENLSVSPTGTNAVVQPNKEEKLGTNAIIGIAVGGGVFLIIVIVIIIVVITLSKRRNHPENNSLELILKSDVMLKDVTIGKCIGEGHFGAVYIGEWNATQVALKSLKGEADAMNKWAEEVSLLSKLNHPNVVRLLGIYNSNDIFYMVLEFVKRGSLDNFLRDLDVSSRLTVNDLIFMGIEVSKGMIYLESKGIIHRDLGARNLLVTESDGKFCVKISDFGMSRETNFYETKDKKIPFRWAAPELIQFSQSSFKADVWSYAVCLWEIFSKGEIPFRSYTNKQVVELVVDQRKHLDQPSMCPDDVYELMKNCWKYDAKDRPNFQDIHNRMLKIHGALPSTVASPNVVAAVGFYHEGTEKLESSVGVYQFG